MQTSDTVCLFVICAVALTACGGDHSPATPARETAHAATSADWSKHGRTDDEQRFSPLAEIDTDTIRNLGLAWYFDIPTDRGIEATPLVVDGTM